jgi:hypothetical protein
MSLSTLGRQLAALNAPGRNLGSALPSSTRHDDAVGRGLAHSVLLGHSSYAKSHLHKPSVIYEDSKKASDVPLTTLRENCVASLKLLEEEVDPAFGPYVSSLCKSTTSHDRGERALLTSAENEELDKKLQDILFRLAVWMTSKQKTTTTTCLHVVEYLLRRYDIHIRPNTASSILLATLPCHEEPFFLRLLQLMDLANLPTWAFLRPYAAPGAKLSRHVLSQQVSKDTALLREICRLTQRNSKLPNASSSLSFTAAVLVEAMTLQTRQYGSMNEKTCQAIVPSVMAACSQSSSEAFQNWGHVLVSSIVESSVLAEEPRNVLVTSILQGIATAEHAVKEVVVLNGLMVVLTILAQPLDGIETTPFVLPILQQQRQRLSTSSSSSSAAVPRSSYVPYPMDKSIVQALLRVDRLAARLGRLHSTEGIVQILDWVASILVVTWRRLSKKKEGKKQKAIRQCLLDLIQEPTLKAIWKQHKSQLVASFTSFVITQSSSSSNEAFKDMSHPKTDRTTDTDKAGSSGSTDKEDDSAKVVLQALRRIDAMACDEGMAHALLGTKRENRRQVAIWLGLKVPDGKTNLASEEESPSDNYSLILPPRVALEHADAKVRLGAIPRVLEEHNESALDVYNESDRESLFAALLRRFAIEEDGAVALATGKALCGLLKKGNAVWNSVLAEAALHALYKWTDFTGVVEMDDRPTILALAVSIASYAAKGAEGDLQILLVEGVGAHIMGSGEKASQEAIAGLGLAVTGKGRSKSAPKKVKLDQVYAMLVTNDQFLSGFRRTGGKRLRRTEQTLRRRFVTVTLEAWNDVLSRINSKTSVAQSSKLASDMVDYCLWMLGFVSGELADKELELLSSCLVRAAKHIASNQEVIPTYFHALAAETGPAFHKAIAPFVQTVCENVRDHRGDPVAFLAVLMEVTLSAVGSTTVVENLLTIAIQYIKSTESVAGIWYGFVPGLDLLQHSEERVRSKALNFLSTIGETIATLPQSEWKSLNSICSHLSKHASSAVMGDTSFLAKCLTTVIREADRPASVCNDILKLCVFAAAACGQLGPIKVEEAFEGTWLSMRPAIGGFHAAAAVLDAAELAGEEAFPLLQRWNLSGRVILDGLYGLENVTEDFLPTAGPLVDSVVRMLKGVKVVDSSVLHDATPKIIISTGPGARGGRARSYSVGKSDGLCFLEPYPKEMSSALVEILSAQEDNALKRNFRDTSIRSILSSKSWGDGIFFKLPRTMRRTLATAVLTNACHDLAENADQALFSLPMDAVDLAELISANGLKKGDIASMSFLADYVTANSKTLLVSNAVGSLVSVLFSHLASLSATKVDDFDEVDFVRQSIVEALMHLLRDAGKVSDKSSVGEWRDILASLVGGAEGSVHEARSLPSFRGKLAALSLLTALCSTNPKLVVPSLVPAVVAIAMTSTAERNASAAFESFAIVVPVYFKYARAADLSLAHLFSAFATGVRDLLTDDKKLMFCSSFIDALQLIPESQSEGFSLVGGFCACLLAGGGIETIEAAALDHQIVKSSDLVSRILVSCDVHTMVKSILSLVVYSKDFMAMLNEGDVVSGHPLLPLKHLENLAFSGPTIDMKGGSKRKSDGRKYSSHERQTLMAVCRALMVVISDGLASGQLRSFVRKGEGVASSLSLNLWQNLLLVQSSCFVNPGGHGNEKEEFFWKNLSDLANESLEYLQNDLPCHIFLASATSLIKEGGTEEIRARAVRLIADRAMVVASSSPEASLFREMVPFLVDLLKPPSDSSLVDGKPNGIILQQSVLATVEIIARSLCILPGKMGSQSSSVSLFTGALALCANVLEVNAAPFDGTAESFYKVDSSSRQLICSASLCSATVVRVCGPQCLPVLPMLMKLLVLSICSSNSFVSVSQGGTAESRSQARMVQLSVLRSLVAVADTLPQFLGPYLDGLLSPSALPSEGLRSEDVGQEFAVKATADRLEEILSTRVPARQLIPAASKALIQSTQVDGVRSLLATLNSSVKASSTVSVASQRSHVLQAATFAYEFAASDTAELMNDANELLLSLILKLSEVQLREVYGKLRDWRGNMNKSNPQNMALRRFAFWRISALLGKELRSIFLPCLTTVFADAIDELVSTRVLLGLITSV